MKKNFINKKIIIGLIIDIVFLLLIFYIDNEMDVFFIHVSCAASWQPVYEVVSHDIPLKEAKRFMELQMQYHYAGWKAVMGLL